MVREGAPYASDVIDSLTMGAWKEQGSKNLINRARDAVNRILREYVPEPLPTDVENNLREVLEEIMNRYNIKSVPIV